MKNFVIRKKRITGLLLAAAVAVTAMGCGTKADEAPASSGESTGQEAQAPAAESGSQENASGASGERVPIRWLTTGDAAAEVIKDGDRIIEEINNRLGIDLTVEIVPEGNTEKVNVAMASGDFPDVVTGDYGTSATQQWIDDGMVIALNDYMDANPDMKAWLESYDWSAINGSYFGIPFITQYNAANALIIMRQDWLDNLGMSYPETLDDMKAVLEAFTFDDPDGNGQNDTYGYSAEKISSANSTPFDWVFFGNGLKYADYALDANDNVIPWFEDPSFIPSMEYIKGLWDSGVIDPELMLNDTPKKEEKFYQGKIGAMPGALFRHVTRHENSLRELNPDASIAYGHAPKGPDGSYGMNKQGKGGKMTCITTACKNPAKAAEFMNFMVSEEGNNLLRLGIEGIHYTKNGDEIVFNEEERAKDAFSPDGWAHALAWGSFYWPLESNYIPPTDPNRDRVQETVELATDSQVKNLINTRTATEIEKASVVDDVFVQYFNDMLQGKIGIEEGAQKLSEDWRSQGGEEILEAVNAVYHAK